MNPYRLPRSVVPVRYDIRIEPDIGTATFTGRVTIEADVSEATTDIVVNAADLVITGAHLGGGADLLPLEPTLDDEHERLTLTPTDGATIPVGPAMVTIEFSGILNDQLRGFYRSEWTDDEGTTRVLGTTQFESTNARRAFPCFDEPDLKAVFAIEMVIADDLSAVSCGEEIHREVLDDGRVLLRFADTMVMSTYLVAWVVGELEATEPVDVDGVPLRIVHVPGKGHLTDFSLAAGEFSLRWLAEYFGIAYPGTKLDLVAVPDFAFGAMENLGCATFREALLLVDPDNATQLDKKHIAEVIAHEIAHMWFGDLVTMRWWDGIWLKEAFATFMETATVEAYKPEWREWEQFAMPRAAAMDTDALGTTRAIEFDVVSPDDAEAMYDILTYEKGASIVRMLEQFLGADRFREAIGRYLVDHAYGNTDNSDLWDAIESATGEPVRSTMDTWILQPGHPAVDVTRTDRGLRLEQSQFTYLGDAADPERRWAVPVVVRSPSGTRRILMIDRVETVPMDPADDWAVVDAGGEGFFRVFYDDAMWTELVEHASERLSTVERFSLVDDSWAAVLGRRREPESFLHLVRHLSFDTELPVWRAMATGLTALERCSSGATRDEMRSEIGELARAALDVSGLEPADGESDLDRELRGLLVTLAAGVGSDLPLLDQARSWLEAHETSPGSVDPELVAAALGVIAGDGSADEYARYLERFRSSPDPQEQLRYLYALGRFPGEGLMNQTLEMSLTDDVRTQNAPFLLAHCIQNRHHGAQAWEFVRSNWSAISERMPSNSISRLLSGVRGLVDADAAADARAFLREHPVPQGQMSVDQYLEKQQVLVELADRLR